MIVPINFCIGNPDTTTSATFVETDEEIIVGMPSQYHPNKNGFVGRLIIGGNSGDSTTVGEAQIRQYKEGQDSGGTSTNITNSKILINNAAHNIYVSERFAVEANTMLNVIIKRNSGAGTITINSKLLLLELV